MNFVVFRLIPSITLVALNIHNKFLYYIFFRYWVKENMQACRILLNHLLKFCQIIKFNSYPIFQGSKWSRNCRGINKHARKGAGKENFNLLHNALYQMTCASGSTIACSWCMFLVLSWRTECCSRKNPTSTWPGHVTLYSSKFSESRDLG